MTWWDHFWTFADKSPVLAGIIGTVVGGLILALILWIISRIPKFRKPVFGALRRLGRFIKSVRLTTTARIEKEHERGLDAGWEGHEREVAQEATSDRPQPPATLTYVAAAAAPVDPPNQDVWSTAVAANPLPLPAPRWHTYWTNPTGDGFDWGIKNSVERSVAREVRIEVDQDYFRLFDAAHWKDLSGASAGTFRGNLTPYGDSRGVSSLQLAVSWFDEHGQKRTDEVRLSMDRPRPIADDTPF